MLAAMGQGTDRQRSYPSAALADLFSPVERWGWTLVVPEEYAPSALRTRPPAPVAGVPYATTFQDWRQRIETEEAVGIENGATVATWSAQRPAQAYSHAVVFGGTVTGWKALLTTLGGSILGSGARLTVVNLSERLVTSPLRNLAKKCGYRVRSDTLEVESSSFDLVSFVGAGQLIDLIVDVIHHDDESTADARADRAVLRKVAEALEPELTSERLKAGLQVTLREISPPGPENPLTVAEYQRLSSLGGAERRDHTDFVQRAADLEHRLEDFVRFERSGRHAPREALHDPEDLRIIEAARTPDRLDFELSVSALIEAVKRRIMRPPAHRTGPEVFVILGADRLKGPLLDTLAGLAEESSLQLVMLFSHLREDSRDALAAGGAAVAFMRLTDPREAEVAAQFIGKDERFVVSQTTRSRSDSYEKSEGRGRGSERGSSDARGIDFGRTLTESVGRSETTSENTSRGESYTASETEQLVEKPYVRQEAIQALAETGLLLVDVQKKETLLVDCDPTIVTEPAKWS